MITDQAGNRYYSVEEAMQVLGMKRTMFQQMANNLAKYRQEGDRRHYYRVEDIEALKDRPKKVWLIKEEKEEEKNSAA